MIHYKQQLEEVTVRIETEEDFLSAHREQERQLRERLKLLEEKLERVRKQLDQEHENIEAIDHRLSMLYLEKDVYQRLLQIEEEWVKGDWMWVIQELEEVKLLIPEPASSTLALPYAIEDPQTDEWTQNLSQLLHSVNETLIDSYKSLAKEQERNQDIGRAINTLEKARSLLERTEDEHNLRLICQRLASLLEARGQGIDDYLYALEQWSVLDDMQGQVQIWGKIARFYESRNDIRGALDAYSHLLDSLGRMEESPQIFQQYTICLNRICLLGTRFGESPTPEEVGSYRLAIEAYYQKWKSIDDLEKVSVLADRRNLPDIRDNARRLRKRLELEEELRNREPPD